MYIEDIITESKSLKVTQKDSIIAKSLMNRVFTNPRALEVMHTPEFRYRLLQILDQIRRKTALNLRVVPARLHFHE